MDNEYDDLGKTLDDTKSDLDDTTKVDDGSSGNSGQDDNNGGNSGDDNGGDNGNGDDGGNGGDDGDGGSSSDDEYEDDGDASEIGISSAYGNPGKKGEKQKSSSSGSPGKGPDRGKWSPIKKDGKDIMSVFYEEFIVAFVEWAMKKAVDLPLDFADYVLFQAYAENGYRAPDNKKDKKTVFDYGREIEEKYKKNAEECKEIYNKAFAELMDNIERNKNGEEPEWRVWGRGAPRFFEAAVNMERAASADPNSPEGQIWNKRVKRSPEILKNLWSVEIVCRTAAIRLATLDEAIKGEEFKLPKDITKKLNKINKLMEKHLEPDKFKTEIKKELDEMRTLVSGDDFVGRSITAKINEMDAMVTGPEKNVTKIKEGLKQSIDAINDINPVTERIETNSVPYYEEMKHNIDKIRQAYPTDIEERKRVTLEYVKYVAEKVNEAQKRVVKYHETNSLFKGTQKAAKHLTDKLNEVSETYSRDEDPFQINLRTRKDKAKESVNAAASSIKDFVVNGREIGSYRDVDTERRRAHLPSNKGEVKKVISKMFSRRSR